MNNKIIISNKFYLYFCGFSSALFMLFALASISLLITAISLKNVGLIFLALFFIIFLLFCSFMCILGLNRGACKIWFENNHFHRKGLLFGFKKTVPLTDIQKLTIATYFRIGKYILIIDNKSTSNEFIFKNGYLAIADTEENRNWIEEVSGLEIVNKID